MNEENLSLATRIMGDFINSRDPIGYTKDTLMTYHRFDEDLAVKLSDTAYKEWVDAYTE